MFVSVPKQILLMQIQLEKTERHDASEVLKYSHNIPTLIMTYRCSQGQFLIWAISAAAQGSICEGAALAPAERKKERGDSQPQYPAL